MTIIKTGTSFGTEYYPQGTTGQRVKAQHISISVTLPVFKCLKY